MTVNRLVVRLVVSHLLVAAVGALATFAIVRAVAPPLFDRALRRGPGGPGPGSGRLLVQDQFTSAVDTSLLLGVGAGVAAAAILGAAAAYRLTRPLDALGEATRRMASGDYAIDVPQPVTKELDDLADDIRGLGGSLAQTLMYAAWMGSTSQTGLSRKNGVGVMSTPSGRTQAVSCERILPVCRSASAAQMR